MLKIGPNLGKLINGAYGDQNYTELMALYRALDLLIQAHVISATTLAPPATPADGDAYIIPAAATGAWLNKTCQIARWTVDLPTPAWEFFTPKKNWTVGVDDILPSGSHMRFNGAVWVDDMGALTARVEYLESLIPQ